MIADPSGIQQPLIGSYRFTEVHRERGVQVDISPRVVGVGRNLQSHTRIGVDTQHNLVGLGRSAVGQKGQCRNSA
ncbi:Uncharacterised protein [Mycobacterium tuberculosis]|nr:Uncharacterised protein [Mycobacterium tuberculosis]